MFLFLTVVQAIIAAALVGVILMQRSEGGGLTGGSPSGMMSARGAADVMTRTTTVLAILFVSLSIVLAVLAAQEGKSSSIDQTLQRTKAAPTAPATGATPAPSDAVPLTGAPASGTATGTAPASAPAKPVNSNQPTVPIDQ